MGNQFLMLLKFIFEFLNTLQNLCRKTGLSCLFIFSCFILAFLFSLAAQANSCCGQNPASFLVLSSEQKLNLNMDYSFADSQGRVANDGSYTLWKSKKRTLQSMHWDIASSLYSRLQLFVSTALIRGTYADSLGQDSSQHWSDTQIGTTYEVLPEYSFSWWKPRVFFSAIANLPTGHSIYDKNNLSEGADVTGHNQWGVGGGLTLKKVYFPLSVTLQLKSIKIFSRRFDRIEVGDFYDNSLAFMLQYATPFQDLGINLDAGITMSQLTARKIEPADVTTGVTQSVTLLMGFQKVITDEWNVGFHYADQTWMGPARNTVLNQTYTMGLNFNYF